MAYGVLAAVVLLVVWVLGSLAVLMEPEVRQALIRTGGPKSEQRPKTYRVYNCPLDRVDELAQVLGLDLEAPASRTGLRHAERQS